MIEAAHTQTDTRLYADPVVGSSPSQVSIHFEAWHGPDSKGIPQLSRIVNKTYQENQSRIISIPTLGSDLQRLRPFASSLARIMHEPPAATVNLEVLLAEL